MATFSRMHQLRAPWMAWWLALALVVAPALGRMHEVLHASGLPHANSAVLNNQSHAGHVVHDLFGEHSVLECLALDQLSHGADGHFSAPIALHALPFSTPVWSTDPAVLPSASALFEARAPPHVTA